MTITIHRPIWQQRFVVVLGSAAVLGGVAFAALQNTETEPAETRTAIAPVAMVASESADYWKNLMLVQDNYLPPTVAAKSADYWKNLQLVQDNYLPPTGNPALAELGDNRTNGPR
jgi:hypothetical protein